MSPRELHPSMRVRMAHEHGSDNHIETSPVTGNPRLKMCANDVMCVVEVLGGVTVAAEKLGVEVSEVETWQDQHYVPTAYAKAIEKMTGWSVWSLQVPPFMEAPAGYWRQDGECASSTQVR